MMKEYQVTLFCEDGKYRPVSCIVKKDTEELRKLGAKRFKESVKKTGIEKICAQRRWGSGDLLRYKYTKMMIREYDKEKIEKEKAERYEQIKKERGWK